MISEDAEKVAKKIQRDVKREGGLFEKSRGNVWQSGWPSYFMYTRELGLRWVQVLGGDRLTWQKAARFRYWSEHGVPIYMVKSYGEFEQVMSGSPNWFLHVTPSNRRLAEDRYALMGLPDPDPVNMAEHRLSNKLKTTLTSLGWIFEKTHGNIHQVGWPAYFAFHPVHGYRWIEMKTPKGALQPTQVGRFNKWERAGVQIWVLNSLEYGALFREPNWRNFPKKKWDVKLR